MPVDLRALYAFSRTFSSDKAENDRQFMVSLRELARRGDLLSYIYYVHGDKHPDIRSFCLSRHGLIMAAHLEANDRTVTVSHPESGKTLLHRSEMEQWIGMQTERCFMERDAPPPSAVYVMGTNENQAEPQVHDIRNTVERNPKYRELFPHARPDKAEGWEKGKWFLKRPPLKNRPEATLIAMGCEGDIQGGRYGKITVDDPISQQDAKSDKIVRDRVRWIVATLERRKLQGGQIRYVFTRWHERDMFGPLSRITPTLVMPVYGYWEAHPEHGYQAETLWPDKWPRELVEIERNKLIDAGEAALFPLVWLCDPQAAKGSIIKREWLERSYGPWPLGVEAA